MNETDYIFLIMIVRPIYYDISELLERKVCLDLTIGQLLVVQIYCCVINHVFLNILIENKSSRASFKLLSDFSNRFC